METFQLSQVLFLDIETVPQFPNFEACPRDTRDLWTLKSEHIKKTPGETPSGLYNRAGIYAEFGRIVCISTGYLHGAGQHWELTVKSFTDKDEKNLLEAFGAMLSSFFSSPACRLCAHNGKEFDFPYIARRMVINEVQIPDPFNISGRKPWEINHFDTMELWKFGDFKNFTSLALLAHIFGIPSPKDDIDGSRVGSVYWDDGDISRIARYCEKDVEALVKIFLRIKGIHIGISTVSNLSEF